MLEETIKKQQEHAKTQIQIADKDNSEEAKRNSYYWGGYDAALNWVLGQLQRLVVVENKIKQIPQSNDDPTNSR